MQKDVFKKWLLTGIVLVTAITIFAQGGKKANNGRILGEVSDSSTGKPLEYATVTLSEKSSKKVVGGATTNQSGHFTMADVVPGHYKVTIEYMGYSPREIEDVAVNSGSVITLQKARLTKNIATLQGVTVTAQTRLIENKLDKIVFNAEKDVTSQVGVATDILKKVPQVSVDVDGNVELAGNGSIRFLINGKPSTAFGASVADVLQSIPASQIKSIEVVTNPGAKYDAQGLGGIINIILKQNSARGINGNLSLTAGTRLENGSFNFNARRGNFGMNAFVSGNVRLPVNTTNKSARLTDDSTYKTLLTQDAISKFKRHGFESGVGFDWTWQKKNSLTGSLSYNRFGNANDGETNQVNQLATQTGSYTTLQKVFALSNSDFLFQNFDAAATYKRKFDKEDKELEISVNSSFGKSRTNSNSYQYLMPVDSLFYSVQNNNPGKTNETQITLDYAQPLAKDFLLGIGGKTTFTNINSVSDAQSFSATDKMYFYDSTLSNNLNYHQKVYAVYAEFTFPVGKLFEVKAGSRFEHTDIQSYYSNAQQQVETPGYNTLVPSIFLSKKFGNGEVVKLSYSKRIERPGYNDLNPFVNTSDPKNVTAGNPYLKPEIGQRYELSYSRDVAKVGSFMVTAFYRNNMQDIQPYVQYFSKLQVGDTVYRNVSVSTRENIGTEKNIGLNIFADVHVTSKFGVRTNLFAFYRHIFNEMDNGADRTSFNYRINLNATYQFTTKLAAEFFGNFNSARNEVQGKYPSFTSYSLAFRKQFWNKKASLALVATNPFNEYVNQKLELYGVNFVQTSERKIPFRSIGLNFTWKFGMLEFKKEKDDQYNDLNTAP